MNIAPVTHASAASFNFSRPPRPATRRSEIDLGGLGRVLENRYLTEELLDASSLSTRYRAYDMATDEVVAVEVLPRCSLRAWPKVRSAVTRLAAHGHPHLVSLLGHGIMAASQPFLVFELHGAGTLRQLLAAEAPLELSRAIRVGLGCADALAALHAAGMVHGRFSSAHVRVSAPRTASERVKIDGFGLAPLIDEAPQGALGGDASEYVEARACSVASDIQQLGLVLRELVRPSPSLRPRPPEQAAVAPDLPRRIFDKIVARCLAGQVQRPYQSSALVASDLRRLLAALEARPRKTASAAREPAPPPKRVPAAIHALPRARGALPPALPKVIVSLGARPGQPAA